MLKHEINFSSVILEDDCYRRETMYIYVSVQSKTNAQPLQPRFTPQTIRVWAYFWAPRQAPLLHFQNLSPHFFQVSATCKWEMLTKPGSASLWQIRKTKRMLKCSGIESVHTICEDPLSCGKLKCTSHVPSQEIWVRCPRYIKRASACPPSSGAVPPLLLYENFSPI